MSDDRKPDTRTIALILDDDDFDAIQREITRRQIDPEGSGLMPEGDSNIPGAILAECIRDLEDYRSLYAAEHPRTDQGED